jgi:hypothetical protein
MTDREENHDPGGRCKTTLLTERLRLENGPLLGVWVVSDFDDPQHQRALEYIPNLECFYLLAIC